MAKITFQIDPERITLDELIMMEEGLTNRQSRDLLARHVSNGNGAYMGEQAAQKKVGSLNLLELKETSDQFIKACQALSDTIVPEATGDN